MPEVSDTQKKDYSTTKPDTMTLEDFEMFEKDRGYKFAFIDGNKSYTVRNWFNKKANEKVVEEIGLQVLFILILSIAKKGKFWL